jgi:outer membrane protein, adhesin transport system
MLGMMKRFLLMNYVSVVCPFMLLCVASLPLLAFGQDASQSPSERYFADVLRNSLETYPDVKAKRATWEAQRHAARAAGSAGGPRVDLNANGGAERLAPTTNAAGTSTQSGASARASLNLRQRLFDGGETRNATQKQERLANVRMFELQQSQLMAMQDFAKVWMDSVRSTELVAVSKASLESHERIMNLLQTRVGSGASRGVDLYQAQSRFSQSKLALLADETALEEARIKFLRLAGVMPPLSNHGFEVSKARLPSNLRAALDEAIASSATLRAAGESAAATRNDLLIAQGADSPRVALEARHDLGARTPLVNNAAGSSVQLTLSMNLFDSGGNRERSNEAIQKLDASRQQFLDEYTKAEQNIRTAWNDAVRFEQTEQNSNSFIESIAKTREAYRAQYEIGQRSLLDLLNSELEYTSAVRQKINARADLTTARLRLLALTGRVGSQLRLPLATETMVVPTVWPERVVQSVEYQPPQASQPFQLPQSSLLNQNEPFVLSAAAASVLRPVAPTAMPSPEVRPTVVAATVLRPTQPPVEATLPASFVAPSSAEQIRMNMGRLPPQLNRDFQNWLGAVATGRKELLDMWYQGGAVAPTIWREGIVAAKGDTSTVIRQFDAQSGSDNDQQIQLGLVALVGDACVRSAQTWKRLTGPSTGPMWRIVGERSITAPMSRCSL